MKLFAIKSKEKENLISSLSINKVNFNLIAPEDIIIPPKSSITINTGIKISKKDFTNNTKLYLTINPINGLENDFVDNNEISIIEFENFDDFQITLSNNLNHNIIVNKNKIIANLIFYEYPY